MPNLPTIAVTDAQSTRMLAAYGSVAAYKQWLAQSIKEFVIHQEALKIDEAAYQQAVIDQAAKDAALAELATSLDVPIP